MSTARRYWLVVIVVGTFLLALGLSVQILLASAFDAHRSMKNVAWAAAQLEIEYLQFKHAFSGYAGATQSVPATFLATRLSVFQNRIRVLKQETDPTELAEDKSYAKLVADLDAVTALDSPLKLAMATKDKDALKAALNKLAQLDSPIRSWVQDVMLHSNPDRQKDELAAAQMKAAGIMSVAILSGIALILLLLRNIKRVESSREREREARIRVDQAGRVKDTFLAVVTHELRTPLNAVIGFSELMKARADKNHDQELIAWTDEVLNAGRNLLTLVNQTIDMSKISAGKQALSPAEFDLRLLVADSVTTIKRQLNQDPAESQRHEVTTSLPPQDVMIRADEAWLRQALLNTILHGRKKSRPDKPIEITVSHGNGRARIDIGNRDHVGKEITVSTAALEPFLQGELGLSRGTHGLGLEMPIAKAIIEAHDGSLHYEASTNSFRVSIDLPLNLAA
ncbi:sensor histidine kinase [Dongia sp.]|uniref:sensor histidine kinase n=1 Tax=Dongia sp. TaxID=1977262 RepID=UPI0035B407A9